MPKIIINNRRPNENSKKFFEDDNISKHNQTIILRYLDSFEGPGNKRSAATIRNNTNMMMYSLKHIKTDPDKLTEDDIDDYKRATGSWTRKDGTPIAKSSTKMLFLTC